MTAAAGCISLAEEALRLTLADGQAFRTFCGASDQAEALARIHVNGLPKPADDRDAYTRAELSDYRPYAIVYTAPQDGFRRDVVGMGGAWQFDAGGSLCISLYQDCPEALDDQPTSDANRQFTNSVGEIIDGLCELAGQSGGYLAFRAIRLEEGPFWPVRQLAETEGLWQGADLRVEW